MIQDPQLNAETESRLCDCGAPATVPVVVHWRTGDRTYHYCQSCAEDVVETGMGEYRRYEIWDADDGQPVLSVRFDPPPLRDKRIGYSRPYEANELPDQFDGQGAGDA